MKAELHGRVDFHEFAEAIGKPTDHIMSVQTAVLVLYTETADDIGDMISRDESVFAAVLTRKPDATLGVMRTFKVGTVAMFKERIEELMNRMDADADS